MTGNGLEPELPPPGLDGTYRGTCVICLQGTDTGLAFFGCAEWVVAGQRLLGVPASQAEALLFAFLGTDPPNVPPMPILFPVRVCQGCVDRSDFARFDVKAGLIPTVPVLGEPVL